MKVIRRTRYRTDGQSGDYMLPPLGSIITISGRFNIDNNVWSKCQHFISTKFRYHKLNTGHVLSQKYKVLIKSLQYWYWWLVFNCTPFWIHYSVKAVLEMFTTKWVWPKKTITAHQIIKKITCVQVSNESSKLWLLLIWIHIFSFAVY